MKKLIFLLIAFGLLGASVADAVTPKAGSLGIGIQVGSLTGADLKFWVGQNNAIELGAGSSAGNPLVVQAADLWHFYNIFHSDRIDLENQLPLYFGIGGLIAGSNITPYGTVNTQLAVRGITGISYLFSQEPFDLFLELSPTLYVSPTNIFSINTGLGGRYYF
jgi:hypothetical protein